MKLKSTIIQIGIIMSVSGCVEQISKVGMDSNSAPMASLTYSTPEDARIDSEKLEQAEQLFIEAVEKDQVLGYQLLIARKDKIVLDVAGGIRDLEHQLPMDERTLIRVASNTKSVTAVGILMLADRGLLNLSDPVAQYLDGFQKNPANKITIEHLLLHQSGYMGFAPFVGDITPYSPETPTAPSLEYEAFKIGQAGPIVEPGTKFRYNNMGYNVLAAIIEKVSQQSYTEFLNDNLYQPLGMNDTSHKLWGVDSSRVARQYWRQADQWEELPPWEIEFPRGNTGIMTTARDFARFAQMLLNGGEFNGQRFLKEATLQKASSPLIPVDAAYLPVEIEQEMGLASEWYEYRDHRDLGLDTARGYGFVVASDGVYSHAGINGTFMYIDPKRDLIGIIFTQSIYGGNPGVPFMEAINQAIID